MIELRRTFLREDQGAFVRLSGDANPMHVDQLAARRTQAGSCVVHGMHVVLWTLESLAVRGVPIADTVSVNVEFARFLHIGQEVELTVGASSRDQLRVDLRSSGMRCIKMELRFGSPALGRIKKARRETAQIPSRPLEPDIAAMGSVRGALAPPPDAEQLAVQLFPAASAAVGVSRVVSIALMSSVVGMIVPGLHSIFSGFAIDLSDAEPCLPGIDFETVKVDERFRLVKVAVIGTGIEGTLTAFARFAPVAAPSLARAARFVRPDEFASRRALVIGGSRGIGAATAKLIAAGGGSVALTYCAGRDDAEAIRDEIAGALSADACSIWPYDARQGPAQQLAGVSDRFTHLYYFATGQIFVRAGTVFDRRRFDEFLDVYIHGFAALVDWLVGRESKPGLNVFYPSSVAVVERPRGMTEYAMAKAAGEVLCADLMSIHPELAITVARLPRVFTDQTATVPPVAAADALEVMLPFLRAERA